MQILSAHRVSEEQQIAAGFILHPPHIQASLALGKRQRTGLITGPDRALQLLPTMSAPSRSHITSGNER
jgi:hypothetical protein